MITSKLNPILISAGCDHVFYESDKLMNTITDQSLAGDIYGLIIEPNELTLEVKANAILEHYPPYIIEILQQSNRVEDTAVNNELILNNLLAVCKKIILYLIDTAEYKQIKPLTVTKIIETKYDANLIGWSMPLDLVYLFNENKDPCI
jgi:hypothetical protein